jgi:hypothetical protein
MTVGSKHLGGFVHTDLGTGRLLSIDSGSAKVRFFRAPTRNPYEDRNVDLARLAPVDLAPHTRGSRPGSDPCAVSRRHRSARTAAAGHAFVQNLRRGQYEIATEQPERHRLRVAFADLALAV